MRTEAREEEGNMDTDELPKDQLTFGPVTANEWTDLETLFEEPGVHRGCWCMYWRVKRAEFNRHYGEDNKQALKGIVDSGRVPGILAYLEGKPVGWCSIAPREEFAVLDRSRTLKRVDDEPVWSIVCFFVSSPYRRRGLSQALIEAGIEYARENGAMIMEAYPLIPDSGKDQRSERYMGLVSTFEKAGFKEVIRRSSNRTIMRCYIRDKLT